MATYLIVNETTEKAYGEMPSLAAARAFIAWELVYRSANPGVFKIIPLPTFPAGTKCEVTGL